MARSSEFVPVQWSTVHAGAIRSSLIAVQRLEVDCHQWARVYHDATTALNTEYLARAYAEHQLNVGLAAQAATMGSGTVSAR